MDKQTIRNTYLKKRRLFVSEELEKISASIANQLLNLDIWNFNNYHLFLSIEKQQEINTQYLLNILMGKDKNIILSKSDFVDYTMTHHLLTDQTILKPNSYGIPEPSGESISIDPLQIDVVFIPMIIGNIYGDRIGYGKGFYDRFLNQCKPEVVKIGLCHFKPIDKKWETHNNDVKLDYIVYPDGFYSVSSN